MWNLEGECIEALYLDILQVQGRVTNSRVKYGGGVQHTITLKEPMWIPYGGRWAETLLIDAENVTRVFSNYPEGV